MNSIRKHFWLITPVIVFVILVAALILKSSVLNNFSRLSLHNATAPYSGSWYYCYFNTDLPSQEIPSWIHASEINWKKVISPSKVPERRKGKNLWLKTVIPANLSHRHIYLQTVLEIFELYTDDCIIYKYGEPDRSISGRKFLGWPWHIIKLPNCTAGKNLYFRIHSRHPKIGIFGTIFTGDRGDLISKIIFSHIDSFVLGFIFIFMGVFIIFLFFRDMENDTRLGYLSLGGFSILMGIFSISKAGSDMKQVLFNSPLLWSYLEMTSIYFAPVGLISYFERLISCRRGLSIIWKVNLLFSAFSLLPVAVGLVPLTSTIPYFQILLLINAAVVFISIAVSIKNGDRQAKNLMFIILVLIVTLVHDVLLVMGVLRSGTTLSQWGTFFFIISLAFFLGKRYTAMKSQIIEHTRELEAQNTELNRYREELEDLVDERTQELHASLSRLSKLNDALHRMSIVDGLTGIFNRRHFDEILTREWNAHLRNKRPLSLLLIDIDHFKIFNDTYGHLTGDKILVLLSSTMETILKRSTDILARYGGEEFAVILPDTDNTGAVNLAEQMRKSIEDISIPSPLPERDEAIHVTISIGVATLVPQKESGMEKIISMADQALYKAKEKGRNRTENSTESI